MRSLRVFIKKFVPVVRFKIKFSHLFPLLLGSLFDKALEFKFVYFESQALSVQEIVELGKN